MLLGRAVKEHLFFEKVRVRVRVRSSKIEVRCASACERIIEVRVCVRHTVKFLATQHLINPLFQDHSEEMTDWLLVMREVSFDVVSADGCTRIKNRSKGDFLPG